MVKSRIAFICQSCGAVAPRWQGRCDSCGAWNSLVEETVGVPSRGAGKGRVFALFDLGTATLPPPRLTTGIGEFDRVLGGGFV
ncbi:MAG: DNA repair protein RadA, partial [Methylovirgula sp.]